MGKIFQAARAVYSRVTPAFIRESKLMVRIKEIVPHDLMYDAAYYAAQVDPPALIAVKVMAPTIVRDLSPRRVIDVGCGSGALLVALRERGCSVQGLEYAEAGLAMCRSRGLEVRKFDLEHDSLDKPGDYHVAVSMEVAEHLPEHRADRFVDLLVSLAPVVVFTAAYPGQGGADHVNEQPAAYWIEKFKARGYTLDAKMSDQWREEWRTANIASWYWQNIMVFRRLA